MAGNTMRPFRDLSEYNDQQLSYPMQPIDDFIVRLLDRPDEALSPDEIRLLEHLENALVIMQRLRDELPQKPHH